MNFKLHRIAKGLSQEKLAECSGVTKQTIFEVEHGKSVRLKTAIKIAKGLGYELNAEPIVEVSQYLETMPVQEAKKLANALGIAFDSENIFCGDV